MESVYYSKLGVCCVCTCQLLCCTWLVWVTDWTIVIYCCSLLMYVKSVYYSILGVYTCMLAAVLYFASVGNWLDISRMLFTFVHGIGTSIHVYKNICFDIILASCDIVM